MQQNRRQRTQRSIAGTCGRRLAGESHCKEQPRPNETGDDFDNGPRRLEATNRVSIEDTTVDLFVEKEPGAVIYQTMATARAENFASKTMDKKAPEVLLEVPLPYVVFFAEPTCNVQIIIRVNTSTLYSTTWLFDTSPKLNLINEAYIGCSWNITLPVLISRTLHRYKKVDQGTRDGSIECADGNPTSAH